MLQMGGKKNKKVSPAKIRVGGSCLVFEAALPGKSLIKKTHSLRDVDCCCILQFYAFKFCL